MVTDSEKLLSDEANDGENGRPQSARSESAW
jgi:hypothetical protein